MGSGRACPLCPLLHAALPLHMLPYLPNQNSEAASGPRYLQDQHTHRAGGVCISGKREVHGRVEMCSTEADREALSSETIRVLQ